MQKLYKSPSWLLPSFSRFHVCCLLFSSVCWTRVADPFRYSQVILEETSKTSPCKMARYMHDGGEKHPSRSSVHVLDGVHRDSAWGRQDAKSIHISPELFEKIYLNPMSAVKGMWPPPNSSTQALAVR